jgi:hypothetical protein
LKKPNSPHGRGPQILSLLAEHGPLSVRGLSEILKPKIHLVRLHKALGRLQKRELIVKHLSRQFRGAGVYYQINQDPKTWSVVSKFTGHKPESLFQPQFRPVEYIHSEACAVWANRLQLLFPHACVLRDYMISTSPLALRLLICKVGDRDFLPDILLILPSGDGSNLVTVAIEIERHMKTDYRTLLKLKKYTNESLVDGVIYVCENSAISKRLRRLYNAKIRADALRINNYGTNFMLFQNETFGSIPLKINLHNVDEKNVDISLWIRQLLRQNTNQRKDHNFDVGHSGTPQLQNA